MTRPTPEVAALLELVSWQVTTPRAQVAPGIWLESTPGTPIEAAYVELCRSQGIEEYDYEAHVLITPEAHPDLASMLDYGDYFHSLVDYFLNILVVALASPMPLVRVLWSDSFGHAPTQTAEIHSLGLQTGLIEPLEKNLTDTTLSEIVAMWSSSVSRWKVGDSNGRLMNALAFFNHAWRSPYLSHMCLNLAIGLETLFAPHDQAEVSHQISYNVARFLETTSEGREMVYHGVKKFYQQRSRLVHGGVLKNDEPLIDPTVSTFQMTARILRKILLDVGLVERFDNESQRQRMLREWMFTS